MTKSHRFRCLSAFVGLLAVSTPARAQQAPPIDLSPVEVSVDLTVNGLLQDVNAAPDCVRLSLPCSHARPGKVAGFGANVSAARNLGDRLAVAADLSAFAGGWDSWGSSSANRRAAARVATLAVGPRVSTGFFDPGSGDGSSGRFYGQVLFGAEASNVVPLRPAVVLGAGADAVVPSARPGSARPLTLRLGLDYVLTPGAGRNLSGWRFVLGFVFGPRRSGS